MLTLSGATGRIAFCKCKRPTSTKLWSPAIDGATAFRRLKIPRRGAFAATRHVLGFSADEGDGQGIGAAQDAVRMQRVVQFYEKLPRGPAPETKRSGLMGRYQARYFGKNPSAARKCLGPACRRGRIALTGPSHSHHPCHRGACSHRLRPELLLPSPWVASILRPSEPRTDRV